MPIDLPTSKGYELGRQLLNVARWRLLRGSFQHVYKVCDTSPIERRCLCPPSESGWALTIVMSGVILYDFQGCVIKGHVVSTWFSWDAHSTESSHHGKKSDYSETMLERPLVGTLIDSPAEWPATERSKCWPSTWWGTLDPHLKVSVALRWPQSQRTLETLTISETLPKREKRWQLSWIPDPQNC